VPQTDDSTTRIAARAFGIVFLLVGIVGFIPGLTTDYERLNTFGQEAAKLLGVFGVNWLENAAHLVFGVAGLALSTSAARARAYFLGSGVVYVLLWLYGLIIEENSSANFLGVNDAGNWLHLALGVVMLGFGLFASGAARREM
jgi:hypothetical protein